MMEINKKISAIASEFVRSMADLAGAVAILADNCEREFANNLGLQSEINNLNLEIEKLIIEHKKEKVAKSPGKAEMLDISKKLPSLLVDGEEEE